MLKKSKISMIYPYLNKKGGVERYLIEIIKILDEKNYKITAFTGEVDPTLTVPCEKVLVRFLKYPNFLASITFSLMFQLFFAKKAKNGIMHVQGASCFKQDIIHAHSVHKSWYLRSIKATPFLSKAWFLKALNPIHYFTILIETIQYLPSNHKKVIAISNLVKNELVELFKLDPNRIEVIYNGVNIEEFHPKNKEKYRDEIRVKLSLSSSDIVLVFVANEFKRKGLEVILNSMHELNLPNVKLLVCGRDSSKDYLPVIDKLNLLNQVHFLGSRGDLNKIYAASDIFIFPTKYEAFGLVITEAMASGLPVVVSNHAGAAELIEDGEDGILIKDHENHIEISNHIKLLMSKNVRDEIGLKAREKSLMYTWDHVTERIIDLYKTIK